MSPPTLGGRSCLPSPNRHTRLLQHAHMHTHRVPSFHLASPLPQGLQRGPSLDGDVSRPYPDLNLWQFPLGARWVGRLPLNHLAPWLFQHTLAFFSLLLPSSSVFPLPQGGRRLPVHPLPLGHHGGAGSGWPLLAPSQ